MQTSLLVPFLNRAADFDPAGWFQLVPKGAFPISRKEGEKVRQYVQVVDDVACQRIVQAFANRQAAAPGYRMLVDFEHFSHDPSKSSAAACWVTTMEARADGVWARGEWSDEGEAAIKNRRYRFLSPVWFPRQTEQLGTNRFRPVEVNDAGLTNKPNLGEALQPFWNREFNGREAQHETDNKGKPMPKERLIAILSLAASATDDQIVEAVQAFKNRASLYDTLKTQHDTLSSDHTALKNRHNTLLASCVEETLTEFAGVIAPTAKEAWKNRLTADYDGTRALLTGLTPATGADGKRVEDTLTEYSGVITAESRDAWKNRLKRDFDGTVELLKSIKKPEKKKPVHGADKGGKGRAEVDDENAGGAFMNRVSEVMTERKLEKPDAIAVVASEEPALYATYREEVTRGSE